MSAMNYLLRLDVIVNGQVAYSETVDQEKAKVGTLGSSTLRLNQPGVSTIHAVIERQGPDSFLLSDLGSAAGTYVNGSRVQRHVISHGDQIYFGDALVIASLVDPNAAAVASPQTAAGPAVAGIGANVPSQITLADGTVVVPYGDSGYYDNDGNYIPGYYDEFGEYHLGYGYVGENGEWVVVYGYYDTQGDWVDTDGPISAVVSEKSNWRFDGISDKRVYTESYFANQGGDTIEVAMIWEDSVLSVTNYKDSDVVTLSADPKSNASYILSDPSITIDPFPLVDPKSGSIYVTPAMHTTICKNGQEMTLEQAIASGAARQQGSMIAIPFDPRTSASVDIGEVTFVIHYTRIPTVILTGPSFDYAQIGFYGISFALHILFLLLIMTIPPDSDALNLDSFGADDRYAELLIQAQEEAPPDDPSYLNGDGDDDGDQNGKDDAKADKNAKGNSSNSSDDDDSQDVGDLPADPTEAQIALKRSHDTKVANSAGILSAFGGGGGGGGIFGVGGAGPISEGASAAIGAISDGSNSGSVGTVAGFGGIGLADAGRGGVGAGEHGVGIGGAGGSGSGGVGTIGRGGKGGAKYGSNIKIGEKRSLVPQIVPGRPTVQGSLDKEIIARVIRQHRNEMKFCYEQQLQRDRSLSGRVVVSFTISTSGAVIIAKVKESTLKNAAVENCMINKIRRWTFPQPKGGGIAKVNYPFNFST